jgi:hypothetical protein
MKQINHKIKSTQKKSLVSKVTKKRSRFFFLNYSKAISVIEIDNHSFEIISN